MDILNFILIIFAIIAYSWTRYLIFIIKSASKDTPNSIQENWSSDLFLSLIVTIVLTILIVINSIFFLEINLLKVISAIILIALSLNKLVEFIITFGSYYQKRKAKNEILYFVSLIVEGVEIGESRRVSKAEKKVIIKNYHPYYFEILKEMKMLSNKLFTCALAFIFWLVLLFMVIHFLK